MRMNVIPRTILAAIAGLTPAGPVRVGQVAPPIVSLTIGGDFDIKGMIHRRFTVLAFWSMRDPASLRQYEVLKAIRRGLAHETRLLIIDVCTDDDDEADHGAWMKLLESRGRVSYGDRDRAGPFRSYEDHKWINTIQGGSDFLTDRAYGVGRRAEAFLIAPDGRLIAVSIPPDRIAEEVAKALRDAR